MNGTITFRTLAELAEFLKAFTGSTATWTVHDDSRGWHLTFTGGF
jgi:hypothetical protein